MPHPTEHAVMSSARNQLTGTRRLVRAGHQVRVVSTGLPARRGVTPRSASDLGLREGLAIQAVFKASATHLVGR